MRARLFSNASYYSYAAIRTVSPKLFALFGLAGRLRYERDRASARLKKKIRKEETKGKAKIDLLVAASGQDSKPSENSHKSDKVAELRSIKAILNSP